MTIAGASHALEVANRLFKEAGAKRVVPLKVSGAFHSMFMLEAAMKLEAHLTEVHFNEPTIPIISNVASNSINVNPLLFITITTTNRSHQVHKHVKNYILEFLLLFY